MDQLKCGNPEKMLITSLPTKETRIKTFELHQPKQPRRTKKVVTLINHRTVLVIDQTESGNYDTVQECTSGQCVYVISKF